MAWVTEEEKAVAIAGVVAEKGEEVPGVIPMPITPLPPEEIGLKPAVPVKVPTDFLSVHKLIKSAVDKAGYRYLCSTVEKLAESLGLEPSVVELHLSVLEVDEAGKFLQTPTEHDRAFCSVDGLQRLVEKLRKLKV